MLTIIKNTSAWRNESLIKRKLYESFASLSSADCVLQTNGFFESHDVVRRKLFTFKRKKVEHSRFLFVSALQAFVFKKTATSLSWTLVFRFVRSFRKEAQHLKVSFTYERAVWVFHSILIL